MQNTKEIDLKNIEKIGFEHYILFDPIQLEFRQDVRDMCSADKCHLYNRSWSCPPACGSVEESVDKAKRYKQGIMLQTTAQMEDSFDVETMLEASETHKERFAKAVEVLRKTDASCLPMGAGGCKICKVCTYPDAPCRFPDMMFPSMEACGLFVSKVCKDNGVDYNYGDEKIAYTCCALYN